MTELQDAAEFAVASREYWAALSVANITPSITRAFTMEQALKSLRAHPAVSNLLYAVARPIQDLAQVVSARTARHVLRNGGSTTYDGVLLQFPPNVGIGFLSAISWHGLNGFEPGHG